MDWFTAALASGILFGVNSIIGKHLLENDSDYTYTYLYGLLGTIFYLPVFVYFVTRTSFNLTELTGLAVLASGTLNIAAYLLFDEAMKEAELSEVVPLTKLQPVFVGILGAIILAEKVTTVNAAGMLLATAGSYIVLRKPDAKLIAPLKKIAFSRAHQYAVGSALLWSSIAIIDRFATQQVPPEIYTFMIYTIMTAGLSTNLIRDKERKTETIRNAFQRNRGLYTLTGLTAAAASLMIFTAFSQAPASKVIPVLQTQVLISVLAGVLLFNETGLKQKTIGSTILIAGIVLVTL